MNYVSDKSSSLSFWVRFFLYFHWPLMILLISVGCVGFLMLYSVAGGGLSPWAQPQIIRFILGLVVLLVAAMIPINFWQHMAI